MSLTCGDTCGPRVPWMCPRTIHSHPDTYFISALPSVVALLQSKSRYNGKLKPGWMGQPGFTRPPPRSGTSLAHLTPRSERGTHMKVILPCASGASHPTSEVIVAARDSTPTHQAAVEAHPSSPDATCRRPDRKSVVAEHTSRVAALVRRQARGRDQAEALQVGLLALLESLEVYDPSRGASLWTFAYPRVREAIADWAELEHFGVKRSGYGANDPRFARLEARRHPESFDEAIHSIPVEDPEALSIARENSLRLEAFRSGLSAADRRALGIDGGHPVEYAEKRNNSLRERAKAFLGGDK